MNYVLAVPFIAHMRTYRQLSLDGCAEEKLNERLFLGRISESQWTFLKRGFASRFEGDSTSWTRGLNTGLFSRAGIRNTDF